MFSRTESKSGYPLRAFLALAFAWGLIAADYQIGSVTSQVRNHLAAWVVIPIRFAATLPSAAWDHTSDYFRSREELIADKRKLEEQLLRERSRHRLLLQTEKDNEALRRAIAERTRYEPLPHVAVVINSASLPFINRIVLSKGRLDGVGPGHGVFNDEGVIGRLVRVNADTSQALLLTDKRFWVASRNQRNNQLVLIQGDGSGRMRLRFVPADSDIKRGDILVTAGGSSSFPAGVPVAEVGNTWIPAGTLFQEGEAYPFASIRQETAVLIHAGGYKDVDDAKLPVTPSGAVPAGINPDVLP